jgi:hypothetical protein
LGGRPCSIKKMITTSSNHENCGPIENKEVI